MTRIYKPLVILWYTQFLIIKLWDVVFLLRISFVLEGWLTAYRNSDSCFWDDSKTCLKMISKPLKAKILFLSLISNRLLILTIKWKKSWNIIIKRKTKFKITEYKNDGFIQLEIFLNFFLNSQNEWKYCLKDWV
jgi:hypothetical protein